MTAPAPIRHHAPAGEIRLEHPGQCWVWACSDDVMAGWPPAFHALYWSSDGENVTYANGYPSGWYAVRTRGIKPPWPTFIDQQDPGDDTPAIEADGFITCTGPSEGFTTPAGGG